MIGLEAGWSTPALSPKMTHCFAGVAMIIGRFLRCQPIWVRWNCLILGVTIAVSTQRLGCLSVGDSTLKANQRTATAGERCRRIALGASHTCVLLASGTVSCWGDNEYSQMTIPQGIGTVIEIEANGWTTCAQREDRTLICWGAKSTWPNNGSQQSRGSGPFCGWRFSCLRCIG